MKLSELDGSVFRYDPTSRSALKRLQKDYPEFESHLNAGSTQAYYLETHRYKVIRYIVLLYDKNSPLWGTIQDFNQRKITALQMAGFEVEKSNEFNVAVQQGIIMGKNPVVNTMIVRYVFLFNNPKFVLLVGLLQVYLNLFFKVQEGNPHKDDVKMFKDTAADIERLTAEVFGGKENAELENTLYEMMHMNKMLFRPEHVAERLSKGEEPTNVNPYDEES